MLVFDDFARTVVSGLGSVPVPTDPRAFWVGGNTWTVPVGGAGFVPTWGTDGDSAYFESNIAGDFFDVAVHAADGALPFEAEAWEALIRFRLTTASIPTDPDSRSIYFSWPDNNNLIHLYLGDTGQPAQITADGAGFVSAAKTWTYGVDYLLRWRWADDYMYARVWLASADEPVAWDVSDSVSPSTSYAAARFEIGGSIGNDGGTAMRYSFDDISVTIPADAGELVERQIPHGSAGLLEIGEAYEEGTLTVTVDDIPVIPTSFDPAGGEATLSAAVFHDPANHPAGCAIVKVRYRRT